MDGRPLLAFIGLAAACTPAIDVTLPSSVLEGKRSVVYAIERGDEALDVFAVRLDGVERLEIDDSVERVRVLLYDDDVTTRFEDQHELVFDERGIELPAADVGLRWEVDVRTDDTASWESSLEPSGRLGRFRTAASSACRELTVQTDLLPVAGEEIGALNTCPAPCALRMFTRDGAGYEFDRSAPLVVTETLQIPTTAGSGALVAVAQGIVPYTGFERGVLWPEPGGTARWVAGAWAGVAVGFGSVEYPDRSELFALTDHGVVLLTTGATWTTLYEASDSTAAPGWLLQRSSDTLAIYRGRRMALGTSRMLIEYELPAEGRVVSARQSVIGGARRDVIGTEAGEVFINPSPQDWGAFEEARIDTAVAAAIPIGERWIVIGRDGSAHQIRPNGDRCGPVAVLDEPVLRTAQTAIGIYVMGSTRWVFIGAEP